LAAVGGNPPSHKFFTRRHALDFTLGGDDPSSAKYVDPANVPRVIALAITMDRPRVSLLELQTVYSIEDLYDLLEVGAVTAYNERLSMKRREEP
jgi:hypothetical protein